MLLLLAALVGVTLTADLPHPQLTKLTPAGIEISIDYAPQVIYKQITYVVNGEPHVGTFKFSGSGIWFHRNMAVMFDNGKLDYKISASQDGRPIDIDGSFTEGLGAAMALSGPVRRAGNTVLRDDFNSLNHDKWITEVSMYGGFNGEFQVYTNDHANVFTRNGHLLLQPTYTADKFGEAFLHTGTMDVSKIWGHCTNAGQNGCVRQGTATNYLPPVMSGKLTSKATIRFGRVEIRARTPCCDWLWPALWMMPKLKSYGVWPRSGEIDIMESRGNAQASDGHVNHGRNAVTSTLHWGSDAEHNRHSQTHGERRAGSFCESMHTWVMDWTCDHIRVTVDGHEVANIHTPPESFWNRGHFPGSNIWASGQKCAPFDQPFYLMMNVAVGGTSGFFPNNWHYNSPKPWHDGSSTEPRDFWKARHNWQSSWHGDKAAMEIDYIQMDQY